jgi:hypothetical protein
MSAAAERFDVIEAVHVDRARHQLKPLGFDVDKGAPAPVACSMNQLLCVVSHGVSRRSSVGLQHWP